METSASPTLNSRPLHVHLTIDPTMNLEIRPAIMSLYLNERQRAWPLSAGSLTRLAYHERLPMNNFRPSFEASHFELTCAFVTLLHDVTTTWKTATPYTRGITPFVLVIAERRPQHTTSAILSSIFPRQTSSRFSRTHRAEASAIQCITEHIQTLAIRDHQRRNKRYLHG